MAAQLILTNVGMLSSSVTKIPEQVEAWEEQNDEKIVKLLRWEDFFFPWCEAAVGLCCSVQNKT